MYLSALEIHGFKSFPTRQFVEFHPGYTCIVGPNGCGKSNVTDAVRWVLGEQSAKSLRGEKMQDVIFNGTDERSRMSFAEVSMHINNQDGFFYLPQEELIITRRYYRSGESEYFLNNQTCRLKDITELFADTGLGKGGYSLIEQGRVDEILSENTDDRRKVFDEAAGIVRYKMRKRESERKLARAEDDLLRINDLSREMLRNLKPLEKQAEEALNYKKIAAELRNLDITLSIKNLAEAEEEVLLNREQDENLEVELNETSRALNELNEERGQILQKRKEMQEQAEELQEKFKRVTRELAHLAEQKALSEDALERGKKRLKDLDPEIAELQDNCNSLRERLKRRVEHRQDLEKRQASFSQELENLQIEASAIEQELSLKGQAEAEREKQIAALKEELFLKRSEKIAKETEVKTQAEEREEDNSELINLQNSLALQENVLDKLRQESIEYQKQVKELEEKSSNCNKQSENLKEQLTANSAELLKYEQELKQREYSLSTLERLEENREGYHFAVKNLSRKINEDALFGRGFIGPVAELLQVEEKYELATEMCLGPRLHNLVCQSKEEAARFIAWLKAEKAGRETFLPLDNIESRSFSPDELERLEEIPGYLGSLADVLQVDPELDLLRKHLGGRIILAEDLDSALAISEAGQRRIKVSSLGGEIIHPGGSLTGGSTTKGSSGLISRSREISEEKAQIESLNLKISELRERREQQSKVFAEKNAEGKSLESRLAEISQQSRNLSADLQLKEQLKKDREIDLKLLSNKLASWVTKQESDEAALQIMAVEIEELQKTIKESEEKKLIPEATKTAEEKNLAQIREKITDSKVSQASVREAIKGLDELSEQLQRELASSQEQILKLEAEKHSLEKNLKKQSAFLLNSETEEQQKEAESTQIIEAQEKLKEANTRLALLESENFQKSESVNTRYNSLQRQKERSKARSERLQEKLFAEKNRIWEEYRLSYNQAKEFAATIELSGASEKRLKVLREELREMPAVNHAAPEQYKELKERYDLIAEQKKDIMQSKEQLFGVIHELEEAMREQFEQEFEAINKEFQLCFNELFSGGSAKIKLAEGDVLESEIEIQAQPPGKRLQSLSLLSGGERALTAIALIFAIFRRKPAPFCFLDEVDSALDEANIVRFADFIRSYTKNTQFVIVTHRKGTMEAADRLYGVSMKERGVSDIISLALSEGEQYVRV